MSRAPKVVGWIPTRIVPFAVNFLGDSGGDIAGATEFVLYAMLSASRPGCRRWGHRVRALCDAFGRPPWGSSLGPPSLCFMRRFRQDARRRETEPCVINPGAFSLHNSLRYKRVGRYLTDMQQSETMRAYILALLLILTHDLVSGRFTSTPKDISPMRTQSVVLKCDPEVTNSFSLLAIHIKKELSSEVTLETPQSGRGDQTDQLDHLVELGENTEVGITTPGLLDFPKYDERLDHQRRRRSSDTDFVRATITPPRAIAVVPANGRFHAEGQIEEPASLTVTIDNPGVSDVGMYECQVTYLTFVGTVNTTSERAQIREVVEFTVEDLEQRVKILEEDRHSYKVAIQEMQKVVDGCLEVNKYVQEDVTALQKKTDDLLNTITELSKEVRSLNSRVSGSSDGTKGDATRGQGSRRGDNQYAPGNARNDELFKLSSRIDQLITNQIHSLAEKLQELRDYERKTQDRVITLELTVGGSFENRLKTLESLEWKSIIKSLQDIEMKTIPLIVMNITDVHRNITEIQQGLATCCENAPDEETAPSSSPMQAALIPTTTTEEPIMNYTGPACFVCGNNITEENCPVAMSKKTRECPIPRPYCMTDVYQDGMSRHVYKRCVSEKECKEDKAKSSTRCSTENFMELSVLECHFCCTTPLCNSDIRPPGDLY